MMDVGEQSAELLSGLADGLEQSAPEVASAYRTMYEELVEAGFTEDQAMTILTEGGLLDAET